MTESPLSYATFGVATHPAIVFLHGFMGHRGDWREVVEALSDTHFCICIDAPGHGKSVGYEDPCRYTMERAVQAVLDILDVLAVPRASLVGYSMGGRLAIALACSAPERWTCLCAEGASPGLRTEDERVERRALDEQRARSLERGEIARFLQAWYDHPFFASMKRNVKRFEALLETRRDNDPLELAASLRMMGVGAQVSYWSQLPDLSMPLLFVVGEDDAKFVDIAEGMQSLCPAAQLAIVRGAGHNVHYERPLEFIKLVSSFLQDHE